MIDLDELERLAKLALQASILVKAGEPLTPGEADRAYATASAFQSAMKPTAALTLVAELRAAREVNELAAQAIKKARQLIGPMPDEHVREPCCCPPTTHPTATAFAAFEDAYDKVTGEIAE
jgi:hypothetical protein